MKMQHFIRHVAKARGQSGRHPHKHAPRRRYSNRIGNRIYALQSLEDSFGINDDQLSPDLVIY